MNPTIKITLGVLIALIVFGGVAIVGINSQKSQTDGGTSPNTQPNLNAIEEKGVTIITYTGQTFEPNYNTVPANSEVRIRNRSTRILQFMSDSYGVNADNPELNQGIINPGDTRTFYPSQQGRWGYHNALDPSETGTMFVQ